MAEEYIFVCSNCQFRLKTWDEGNPYIQAPNGKRHYFYHPGEEKQLKAIARKILRRPPTQKDIEELLQGHSGNESEYICYGCCKASKRDPEKDKLQCPCGSTKIVRTFELAGRLCPKCQLGKFGEAMAGAIS